MKSAVISNIKCYIYVHMYDLTVLSAYSAHLSIWIEFKNTGWTKLKFYLYQNEEWLILNKKSIFS